MYADIAYTCCKFAVQKNKMSETISTSLYMLKRNYRYSIKVRRR